MRTWTYLARRGPVGWSTFCDSPRLWHMYGQAQAPQRIVLVEDPAGDYLGWLDAARPGRLSMVQHARLFEMQSPYGSRVEVDAGRGEKVALRVEPYDTSAWDAVRPGLSAAEPAAAGPAGGQPGPGFDRFVEMTEQAAVRRQNRSVLVAGCGTGPEVIALARAGFDVTALDLSETAVVRTRALLDAEGLDATLHVDDLVELPARTGPEVRRYDHGYTGVVLVRIVSLLPVVAPGDCLLAAAVTDLAARGQVFHLSTAAPASRPLPGREHTLPLAAVASAGHEVVRTDTGCLLSVRT